ncbi:MAG: hypothetical protein ACK55I_30725, partial [bacterium]
HSAAPRPPRSAPARDRGSRSGSVRRHRRHLRRRRSRGAGHHPRGGGAAAITRAGAVIGAVRLPWQRSDGGRLVAPTHCKGAAGAFAKLAFAPRQARGRPTVRDA